MITILYNLIRTLSKINTKTSGSSLNGDRLLYFLGKYQNEIWCDSICRCIVENYPVKINPKTILVRCLMR